MSRTRIRLGISACLLGENVRYDGGHKLDRFFSKTFGRFVDYVSVCPEKECGLGVPREPMRLVGDPESPSLVTIETNIDQTARMLSWTREKLVQLEKANLCGFIFKSRSPSDALSDAAVYGPGDVPVTKGPGVFARAFMERFPLIPAEDEERLHDPKLRENFIERIFSLREWRQLRARKPALEYLSGFHRRHRLLLLSHSERHLRIMDGLLAGARDRSPSELYRQYEEVLLRVLKLKGSRAKNLKVLHHVVAGLEKMLAADEAQELLESIHQYGRGRLPLIVPLTLLKHYLRRYRQADIARQAYLNPHPVALQLRYHC